MLSKPRYGWSNFQLKGTHSYSLSYLDDIAFEWLEQAIHGLKTMSPFCVKGYMEPDRFMCVVSYWNCHIICEDENDFPLKEGDIINEHSHTSMIEFCKSLYNDIHKNFKEWLSFVYDYEYDEKDRSKKRKLLKDRLNELEKLISEKEELFEKCHFL